MQPRPPIYTIYYDLLGWILNRTAKFPSGFWWGLVLSICLSGCSRAVPDPAAAAKSFYEQHLDFYTLEDVEAVREAATPRLYGLLHRLKYQGIAMGYFPEVCAWTDGQDGWITGEPEFFVVGSDGRKATVRMDYDFELESIERRYAMLALEWDGEARRWRMADLAGPDGVSFVDLHEAWFQWKTAGEPGGFFEYPGPNELD